MQYFYHSDHFGSVSFVTDRDGAVCQHIQYLPFGELFVSQRNSEFDSRYKFTAKELDNETSYTYFGARYYDSDLSVWLSVDPMSDKYPGLSPYIYSANNPVVLVDPNGEKVYIVGDAADEATAQLENNTSSKFNIIRDNEGNITYEGKARSYTDKKIKEMIDDEKINVNIIANNSNSFITHDGKKLNYPGDKGGVYGGNEISEDGKVNTYQYVNPDKLAWGDILYGDTKYGGYMLHELAESYYAGKIALEKGKGDEFGGEYYTQAHNMANTLSSGEMHKDTYNIYYFDPRKGIGRSSLKINIRSKTP